MVDKSSQENHGSAKQNIEQAVVDTFKQQEEESPNEEEGTDVVSLSK